MAIDLSALSTRQALTAIYIGYYDRAADPAGIQFWEQVVANTSLDLVAITTDFAGQSETQAVHPFFADPATSSPATFITSLYQNLFNRDPDAAGLEFWSNALQDAIDGVEGAITVGQIITSIIEGAVDVEGGTQDRTTILNKIEVGLDWTEAAEAAEIDYTSNAAAQASAKSIIEGVTDDPATVAAAKATTDDFFTVDNGGGGGTPGEQYLLTSATDVISGTENDDEFLAYIQQNPFAGGVSNSMSSADRLDGGAGADRLYAELSYEFVGTDILGGAAIDLQPRVNAIEEIDIEARDTLAFGGPGLGGSIGLGIVAPITVDAKNIWGHNEIGSFYSDGDLLIENLTTLTAGGGSARNTSEITVTMDHTDNFNSDEDASDLTVYFDNDYLLSGQESEGEIRYFILDEEAERLNNPNRLENIDVDGIRFNITNADGSVTAVVIEADEANTAGTHQGFVNALQPALQALIADGTLPAGTTLTLNPALTDFTFLDDGSRSDDIPAIVLTSGDGSRVEATGFSRIEEEIGEYDVYGRFESRNETSDQPITVDIDLHKAGRGGEGGNLIVGGKSENNDDTSAGGPGAFGIADGIEVFNISVKGAGIADPNGGMVKPSNVGTITSTGSELRVVNIVTDPAFATGATFASLVVRNGFDQNLNSNVESGDLQLVNADGFLGDLVLGDIDANNNAGRITNLDTLTAQGGGDVEFNALLDGTETAQAYSYTTGSGDDIVTVDMNGDALDYAGSSLNIATNAGDDEVRVIFSGQVDNGAVNNNQLNQAILDNVNVETGAGDDVISVDGVGNANIEAGTGDDIIYTDGNGAGATWAFNFDAVRAAAQGLSSNAPEDLPGEQTSLAYLGNASVTVTFSGAGIGSYAAGGGVMSQGAAGAVRFDDGYENIVTIGSLNNGNEHYGDQTDINDAVLRAINDDPILGNILTASIGANNTLVVTSIDGAYDATDLRIEVRPQPYTDANYANSVRDEARILFGDSTIATGDLFAGTTASSAYDGGMMGYGADLSTSAMADMWYDGLSVTGDADNSTAAGIGEGVSNLHTMGSASTWETDNVIDAGPGDDLIVMSTDATANTVTPFTNSSNNAMMNGASNETIVLTTLDFGEDTVMNFTFEATEAGVDFLDFTAYLTSMTSPSGSSASTTLIPVTMDNNLGSAAPTDAVAANEVVLLTLDADNNAEWEAFGAADLAALFNNSDGTGDYDDDLLDSGFSVVVDTTPTAVVNGASKAIVGVENADNDGEIRFFELTWNSSNSPATLPHTVSVVELGELDFGDTPDAASAANLIGSTEYADLLAAFPGGAGVML